ncbi:hypothetical protein PHISCL_10330 [Aspergillus sclerotialis]|uniref:Uncharacterized protein n=1 Tax=Aspergillus sclerotialis TaxID=2070753 RepID=A0A3A2Z572_9EURO|nr:hypothetical protein PHISCL_10330 [Aspergillus sclerotialis]
MVDQAVEIIGNLHAGLTLGDNLLVEKLFAWGLASVVPPPRAAVAVAVPGDQLEHRVWSLD